MALARPQAFDDAFDKPTIANCNVRVYENGHSTLLLDKASIMSYKYSGRNEWTSRDIPTETVTIVFATQSLSSTIINKLSTVRTVLSIYYTVDNIETNNPLITMISEYKYDPKTKQATIVCKSPLEFQTMPLLPAMKDVLRTVEHASTYMALVKNYCLDPIIHIGTFDNDFYLANFRADRTAVEIIHEIAINTAQAIKSTVDINGYCELNFVKFSSHKTASDIIWYEQNIYDETEEKIDEPTTVYVNDYGRYSSKASDYMPVLDGTNSIQGIGASMTLYVNTVGLRRQSDDLAIGTVQLYLDGRLEITKNSFWDGSLVTARLEGIFDTNEISSSVNANNTTVVVARLISSGESALIKIEFERYYQYQTSITWEGRINPAIQPLDILRTENKMIAVEQVDIEFDGGFEGKVYGRDLGVTPAMLSLSLSNITDTYKQGDAFVNPTVTVKYADGTTADVTASCTFTGYDIATGEGRQTVTVSYTEDGQTITTTYAIYVQTIKAFTHSVNATTGTIQTGGKYVGFGSFDTGKEIVNTPYPPELADAMGMGNEVISYSGSVVNFRVYSTTPNTKVIDTLYYYAWD